jgi:hypothetical protein
MSYCLSLLQSRKLSSFIENCSDFLQLIYKPVDEHAEQILLEHVNVFVMATPLIGG